MTLRTKQLWIVALFVVLAAKCAFGLQSPRDASLQQNATLTKLVTVQLAWNPSSVAGLTYRLYSSGALIARTGNSTIWLSLQPNIVYTFWCTVEKPDGGETAPSNTLVYLTPGRKRTGNATAS